MAALEYAIEAMARGEPFEALAFLHGAKGHIEEAETLIDAERKPLGPPQEPDGSPRPPKKS
jgi:hypothetical protein